MTERLVCPDYEIDGKTYELWEEYPNWWLYDREADHEFDADQLSYKQLATIGDYLWDRHADS